MRLIATRQGIGTVLPLPAAARRSWLKRLAAGLGAALLARPAAAGPANTTGADPYIGEIMLFAGFYAPAGWLFCNGQSLNISDNVALYTLIGTTYGGDGQTTFNLPNLQGRVPRHIGASPSTTLGQAGGATQFALSVSQMPGHTHPFLGSAFAGTSASPAGNLPAAPTGTDLNGEVVAVNMYAPNANANNQSASAEIGNTGGNQPVPLTPATVEVNYCISIQGQFPTQQ